MDISMQFVLLVLSKHGHLPFTYDNTFDCFLSYVIFEENNSDWVEERAIFWVAIVSNQIF